MVLVCSCCNYRAARKGCYLPSRVAELAEARLKEVQEEDEEGLRRVKLVQGWIESVKLAKSPEDSVKEAKSLETFLCQMGDDFLGAKEGLKKEVEKQEQEWKSLARFPLAFSELQPWPRLVRLDQRKSCRDLTASEVSDLLSDLKACWKKHREAWPERAIPAEPPSLKPYFRGDLYEADPLQNEKRAQAAMEFFNRNAKWRERWDQAAIPACVKRALRTAKDLGERKNYVPGASIFKSEQGPSSKKRTDLDSR